MWAGKNGTIPVGSETERFSLVPQHHEEIARSRKSTKKHLADLKREYEAPREGNTVSYQEDDGVVRISDEASGIRIQYNLRISEACGQHLRAPEFSTT